MTPVDQSWQLGGINTLSYRLFDAFRRRLNVRLARYLLGDVIQARPAIILEAGSGTAYASSLLRDVPQIIAIALDYDEEALREARRRDPALPVVVGDLRAMPFRADAFNGVWNSSTIEHLSEPAVALAEMARLCRSEGTVFTGVPALYGPLGFQRWIARTGVGIWIGTVFSAAALAEQMRHVGLQPVAHTNYFFRFFVGVSARKS
jgi:ubiquinone/menaquinone biosynthesis C-methylase UbiE